jgi:squalene-hopene/tetraprenyl-beta-curcumene cyclase
LGVIHGAEPVSWDREGAARYLDERIDLWLAKGKKLRTGEGETVCVSCHTSFPYLLARPVLRRAIGVSEPTPQERRLLADAVRRVETYSTHQLLYEGGDRKKAEARGTEAVLNALILASADAAQFRREASGPTRQALARLWETQRPDGAWDWLDFGLEPFETADAAYHGAALAALAVGIAPGGVEGTGVAKLHDYLKNRYASQSLYQRVWMLLAPSRCKDLLTPGQRGAAIAELQRLQRDDGGWALQDLGGWKWSKAEPPFRPPGTPDPSLLARPDGYATGLIVYTMRQAGLPASHPAVSRGLRWLSANQGPAWRAYSLNFDREHGGEKGEPWRRMFMSDAATAFAVLALSDPD